MEAEALVLEVDMVSVADKVLVGNQVLVQREEAEEEALVLGEDKVLVQ